jgi:hypothetical protein
MRDASRGVDSRALGPIAVLMAAVAIVSLTAPPDPISWDGVAYVQSARNFALGNGFLTTQSEVSATASRLVPLRVFPPGFSFAAAIPVLFGASAQSASLWLTRLTWMLLPLCAAFAFRTMGFSRRATVALAALVSFAPGIIEAGLNVHSDLLFLDLILLSAGLLIRSISTPRVALILLSGTLAGAAYTVRNVGLAFFVAGVAFFAEGLLPRSANAPARPRLNWRGALLWLGAAAPWVIAIKLRSLVVFGVFEPYSMPPSTMGLAENVRWLLFSTLSDLTSMRPLAWLVWNKFALAGGMLIVAAAIVFLTPRVIRWFKGAETSTRGAVLMAAAYAAASGAMLVAARTKYDWNAIIDERYATQYTWGLLTLGGLYLASRSSRSRTAVTVVCGILLAARIVDVYQLYAAPFPQVLTPTEAHAAVTSITSLPPDAIVVSNEAATLTVATDQDIRQFGRRGAKLHELVQDLARIAPDFDKRPLFGAFVASGDHANSGADVRAVAAEQRFYLVPAAADNARAQQH